MQKIQMVKNNYRPNNQANANHRPSAAKNSHHDVNHQNKVPPYPIASNRRRFRERSIRFCPPVGLEGIEHKNATVFTKCY